MIRFISTEDAKQVSELIINAAETVRKTDCSERGWAQFVQLNTVDAVKNRILSDNYMCLCYEIGTEIAGIITIKNQEKIEQLFVNTEFRRKGIAKQMWEQVLHTLRGKKIQEYFVYSSTFAVQVYEKLGFQCSSGLLVRYGCNCYYMIYRQP